MANFILKEIASYYNADQNVFQPKQQRSQDAQRKLLAALHLCLPDKFFEHTSIKELVDHAGVSVGTFYRRIANLFLNFRQEITATDPEKSADVIVFIMINDLLDKVLFPTLTPPLLLVI